MRNYAAKHGTLREGVDRNDVVQGPVSGIHKHFPQKGKMTVFKRM
jgi:hypothetical protein